LSSFFLSPSLSPLTFLLFSLPSTPPTSTTTQVEDCPDSVTVNNNKRVRLCNAHADASSSSSAGGGIFLQWVPAARAETAARRFFPEQGWYLVRYCKQRAHTKWLGAFRRDVKTGELQRK